jgi:hypothetical protein
VDKIYSSSCIRLEIIIFNHLGKSYLKSMLELYPSHPPNLFPTKAQIDIFISGMIVDESASIPKFLDKKVSIT